MPEFQGTGAMADADYVADWRDTDTGAITQDSRGDRGRSGGLFGWAGGGSEGAPSTGLVLGAAAVGIGIGLLANLGRKAAVQGMSAMSGDWFDALRTEHRMALAIFDRIEATSTAQAGKRKTLLTALKHALQKHAFQEENVVYPSIRETGERGSADHLDHDHAYVKTYLYELEVMSADDPRWLPRVQEFRRAIESHVREEEDEIFPALRARLSDAENKEITGRMNKEGLKLA